MNYQMTPEAFFGQVIELYREARKPKFQHENISRGRSATISSSLEDLIAQFISMNNPNDCQYYIDQPLSFKISGDLNSSKRYPDVVIQNTNGEIANLIDVKTDIGWNRSGMYAFCQEWDDRVKSMKNLDVEFTTGRTREFRTGKFSKNLHYHVVVLATFNSGKKILEDYKVVKGLENVSLYILSKGVHPNSYDYESPCDVFHLLDIDQSEFTRLFENLQK